MFSACFSIYRLVALITWLFLLFKELNFKLKHGEPTELQGFCLFDAAQLTGLICTYDVRSDPMCLLSGDPLR